MGKKTESYIPFYPTTVGVKSHDITLQQLPAYSIRAKPELKTKCCNELIVPTHCNLFIFFLSSNTDSPGPGAYPQDDGKKSNLIPKSIYPEDKAYKYSLGIKGYIFKLRNWLNIG